MRSNIKATEKSVFTHNGGKAYAHMTDEQALRRSVMSCLLWEKEFYENGQSIATRISDLSARVSPMFLSLLAREVRHSANLRHVALLLLCELVKHGKGALVSETIAQTISRADELAELLAMYWRDGKRPLAAQLKKGLALAFDKFDEYALAKYDRANAVKLRDVLFLSHAKPRAPEREALFKRLIAGELATPDTWEVALSAGANKRETFTRLIEENKLGYFALLRNLRNMLEAGVDRKLIERALVARKNGADKVLPFRFIAAARAAPQLEASIDIALCEGIATLPALKGRTVVLVDVSNSMSAALSDKSDLTRLDAACALASIINAEELRVFSFSSKVQQNPGRRGAHGHYGWGGYTHSMNVVEVPPRRGMSGVDAIVRSQERGGTLLFSSVNYINESVQYDRLIVITDEQADGASVLGGEGDPIKSMPDPKGLGYLINVASAQNGVGYGPWLHIDGFSENVLRFIHEVERDRQ